MNLLVFDSGIGGLGVVAEIRKLQPEASIAYLADNGFYPYGEQPDATLITRILAVIGQGIETLRPDAIVIACNTASTVALSALRETYGTPFIGCVPPIKPAAAASRTRHIGLLATSATIRRPYLADLTRQFAADCTLHSHGTPILADLAEAKFRGQPVTLDTLAAAIAPLLAQPGAGRIDTIALGCTHYTFLLPELSVLHPAIQFFDPANPVARRTAAVTAAVTAALAETGPAAATGTAFFTAAPADAERLRPSFAGFGFSRFSLL